MRGREFACYSRTRRSKCFIAVLFNVSMKSFSKSLAHPPKKVVSAHGAEAIPLMAQVRRPSSPMSGAYRAKAVYTLSESKYLKMCSCETATKIEGRILIKNGVTKLKSLSTASSWRTNLMKCCTILGRFVTPTLVFHTLPSLKSRYSRLKRSRRSQRHTEQARTHEFSRNMREKERSPKDLSNWIRLDFHRESCMHLWRTDAFDFACTVTEKLQ